MISFSSPTRKQYTFTLDNAIATTASVSVERVSVSIKPYGTNETVTISEVTNSSGSVGTFPKSEQ
jgi:hypothetical protein